MKRKTKSRATPFALSTLITVIVAFVAFIAIGSSTAAPSGAAEYTLYAGQNTDVGTVYVWNDATKLYVEIDLDGWCMTESHVAVASDPTDIPQTKTGNPIPGKFAQSDTYVCADVDTFEFLLSGFDTTPVVAVHLKVWEKTTSTVMIASNVGDQISTKDSWLAAWPVSTAAVVPAFAGWPAISGASYISNQAAGDLFNQNWWRKAAETLNVPGLPVEGELQVNSDNYEFSKLNGTEIERDEDGGTATVEDTGPEPTPTPTPQAWNNVKTVPFTPVMGSNSFEFVFRNATWGGGGSFTDNPTGLAYKATATYYAHSESAWAGTGIGTIQFPGANWATYITYGVQNYVVGDTGVSTPYGNVDLDFEVWGGPPVAGTTSWVRTVSNLNTWEGPVVSASFTATTASFVVRVASGTPAGIDQCDIGIAVVEGGAGVGTWNITSVGSSPSETCPFIGQTQGPYTITTGSIDVFVP